MTDALLWQNPGQRTAATLDYSGTTHLPTSPPHDLLAAGARPSTPCPHPSHCPSHPACADAGSPPGCMIAAAHSWPPSRNLQVKDDYPSHFQHRAGVQKKGGNCCSMYNVVAHRFPYHVSKPAFELSHRSSHACRNSGCHWNR